MPETLTIVPKPLAIKLQVLPLFVDHENGKDVLAIAMANPGDLAALDEIHFASRMEAKPIIASDPQLNRAIEFYYSDIGIPTADRDAKKSTEFTFGEVVAITREFLSANKSVANAGTRDMAFRSTAATQQTEDQAASSPANSTTDLDDESIIVFNGGQEQKLSLDDGFHGGDESALKMTDVLPPSTAATSSPTIDVNTEKILRALVDVLLEKGLITKAEIKQKLK